MSDSSTPPASTPPCVGPEVDASRWFEDEVHAHGRQLKSYLRGTFPSVRDVDDVVQESYLRVWKANASRPINSAKAYLYRIARNIALDFLHEKRRSPIDARGDLSALPVIDSRPSVQEAISTQEKLKMLVEAIVALPPRCREVILLHRIDGLPQKEVAEKLGLSVRTVENHSRTGAEQIETYLRARGITHLGE